MQGDSDSSNKEHEPISQRCAADAAKRAQEAAERAALALEQQVKNTKAANRRATIALIIAIIALFTAYGTSRSYFASIHHFSPVRFHKSIHRHGTQAA